MELSVQEIIAKVAVQRQRQKQAEKKQQLLKQINNKSSDVKQLRINYSKNAINPTKPLVDTTVITQKYKQLQAFYKKLKIQISTQMKMDKKYGELMEKLTKVIEKNGKLQTELDSLRMKRSAIVESEKSLNEQNQIRNKSKKWMTTEYVERSAEKSWRGRKSLEARGKCVECCECVNKQITENKNGGNESKRASKQKSEFESTLNAQQTKHTTFKTQTQDLTQQINQYKSLIEQKQSSINKLHFIRQKQQELIKQYEASFVVSDETKAGGIRSKVKEVRQASEKKVEGTIVKVKREIGGAGGGGEMGNRAITDRREMFANSCYQFLSPAYIHDNQQKTRKKPQQPKHLPTNNKTMQLKSPAQQSRTNRPYTYIPSIPSQQQSSNPLQYFYRQQENNSPSQSINETSEFLLGGEME